jgi:2-amino-4-hydroxy-6-hydroxymethyldihydropteridine diphosphokinase
MVQDRVHAQKDRLAIIALGANLTSTFGAPRETILASLSPIARNLGSIVTISRVFRTPAVPKGSGPDFVNAVIAILTELQPADLLAGLHAIEAGAGRQRVARWRVRTLDLDLLAVGDTILPDQETQKAWMSLAPDRQGREAPPELILPHPRLQDRAFVLIPLADICPGWRHPVSGLHLREMVATLSEDDKAAICPI